MQKETAVMWTSAAPGAEVISQKTGRDITGKPSRICKQFLFEQFAKLCDRINPLTKVADWK